MNMAVHGLTGVIKSGDEANTFYHDAHNLNGCCDYVMANPPFNVDKVKSESAQSAGRLPFGLPGVNKGQGDRQRKLFVGVPFLLLPERAWPCGFCDGVLGYRQSGQRTRTSVKTHPDRPCGRDDERGQQLLLHQKFALFAVVLDKGKPEHLLDTVLFIRCTQLLYRGGPHSERVERLAAEEPQRHCLALSRRGGQVQRGFGGVSRRTGRRPPLCRDSGRTGTKRAGQAGRSQSRCGGSIPQRAQSYAGKVRQGAGSPQREADPLPRRPSGSPKSLARAFIRIFPVCARWPAATPSSTRKAHP